VAGKRGEVVVKAKLWNRLFYRERPKEIQYLLSMSKGLKKKGTEAHAGARRTRGKGPVGGRRKWAPIGKVNRKRWAGHQK